MLQNTVNETTDDDIYGDLESEIFKSCYKQPILNKNSELELQQALKEKETLKAEIRRLSKENKAYATNISSLYFTAKNEIDKKNFIIKQLQTRLLDFTTSKAQNLAMSKKEITEILKKCQDAHNEAHTQTNVQEITKTIQFMKTSKSSKVPGKKKLYKFGNMSLFFCREQVPFKRSVKVEFPVATPPSSRRTSLRLKSPGKLASRF